MTDVAQNKPKRRFWQFHLSTLVLLVIVNAVFLLVNMSSMQRRVSSEVIADDIICPNSYGWPYVYYVRTDSDSYYAILTDNFLRKGFWLPWNLANDISIYFCFSVAVAAIVESRIRKDTVRADVQRRNNSK